MTLFILRKSTYLFLFLLMNFQLISCAKRVQNSELSVKNDTKQQLEIKTGAENTELYLDLLKGKNIAIVANQTSVLSVIQRAEVAPNVMGSKKVTHHLVDYLHQNKNINVKKVFAPEHGFRGKADAAEIVKDGKDTKTGLPIISLYGKNKKPKPEQLKNIDVVVFDIQDVGVRFYTYISTLHYVMEACAEAGIPVIVLDRPNPNGHYVDGPVLEMKHTSFVGKHPVPVVYGMTIGEYGQMINGEKWLKNGIQCDLKVIPLKNYNHNSEYSLTIRPSPNLPNDKSINLYPSLGFFEGTIINAGRGTEFQFQRYGASFFPKNNFSYTPKANFGAKYPKEKGKLCYGIDLSDEKKLNSINLEWLIDAYNKTPKTEKFFGETFTIHAGNTKLQQQIEQGLSAKEIRNTWQNELQKFQKIRERYLIYD
ncbi:exo-beta-N-acetylmuramidase NamZ domain-containing protein [Polaribacter sp. Asnod6-C07]|uniref:exo-beta-N-acetylmuramidase NamZ family protein n=1 Tax=Polaribacter sp. Asnod6-C07 TaxID=3160582 RepID=UPI00386C7353